MNKIWFPLQRAIRTAVQVVVASATILAPTVVVAPQILTAIHDVLPGPAVEDHRRDRQPRRDQRSHLAGDDAPCRRRVAAQVRSRLRSCECGRRADRQQRDPDDSPPVAREARRH